MTLSVVTNQKYKNSIIFPLLYNERKTKRKQYSNGKKGFVIFVDEITFFIEVDVIGRGRKKNSHLLCCFSVKCFFFFLSFFFNRHLLNLLSCLVISGILTFLSFGWSSKFAFPPCTVIKSLGNSRFHSFVKSWTNNSGRVSNDSLTYWKIKKFFL